MIPKRIGCLPPVDERKPWHRQSNKRDGVVAVELGADRVDERISAKFNRKLWDYGRIIVAVSPGIGSTSRILTWLYACWLRRQSRWLIERGLLGENHRFPRELLPFCERGSITGPPIDWGEDQEAGSVDSEGS